jgi:long-chain acyl-CoA synthetase
MFGTSLRRAARIHGNRFAFLCQERSIDWSTLLERASRLSTGLGRLGIVRGDRVAMLLPNGLVGIELFASTVLSGHVIVPLNFRWSVDELADALADCAAKALVVDDHFRDSGVAAAARAQTTLIDGGSRPAEGSINYEGLFDAFSSPINDCAENELLAIFYTGGTTGRSKGVMLSHGNAAYVAMASMAEGAYGTDEIYLHTSPSFHIAGAMNVFQAFICASRNVVLPRFEAGAALAAISAEGVTQSLLVPTMIGMILDHSNFTDTDTSSIRRILYGAAPMTDALLDRAMVAFPRAEFMQLYGMTETTSNACILHSRAFTAPDGKRLLSRSVGRAMVGSEVGIFGVAGNLLPPGEVGEIAIRGPGVMLGYWNRPDATAAAVRGGWMHTGDGGSMDAEGYVYLADRIKDMIISGGENIYSLEVEAVLVQHPSVRQCAVIGIPHSVWGEAVHAIVTLNDGELFDERALIDFCRGKLSGYKLPRSIEHRDELPLTAAGKVVKRDLRAPFWAHLAPSNPTPRL